MQLGHCGHIYSPAKGVHINFSRRNNNNSQDVISAGEGPDSKGTCGLL